MFVPLILATIAGLSLSLNLKGPVFDLPDTDDEFRGVIRSSAAEVDVTPEIKILEESGPICSYNLEWDDSTSKSVDDIPFRVDLVDRKTGKAHLRLKEGESVKCGETSHYSLLITGKGCDNGKTTDSVSLEVTVEADNSHPPEFSQSYYEVTIEEGRLYDQILKLKATDADCEGKFSKICGYEITNNAAGFSVSNEGVLKNSEPLSFNNSHSHILTLTAHDCGHKASKEVVVTVYVKRSCAVGWLGFKDRLDYSAGAGAQPIAPAARLNFCDLRCQVASINSTFTLNTEHIGRGCDRDPELTSDRVKICGRNEKTVSLLPAGNIAVLTDKTAKVPTTVDESATEVFFFDGKSNAAEVSDDSVNRSHIGKLSTITFWMKHQRSAKAEHRQKEHILCNSDAEHKNRHHFALFVRNCKLELVVRQEYPGEGKNHYEPTEWRWATPAVCDNNWHQYAVNVKFPKVEMYVDGHHFAETEKNTEVLEDWPMHATKDQKTRTVVGACWHGGVGHMAQFFNGFLSGVTLLSGEVEAPETIECLHRCKESLEFHGLDKLKAGLEVLFNNEMTQVTLKGKELEAFEEMMQNVGYINSRQLPTPGHRSIKVETSVKCQDSETVLRLGPMTTYVFVQKAHNPEIVLFGSRAIAKTLDEVKQGVAVFEDLSITVMQENAEGVKEPSATLNQLESCQITTSPLLKRENEYLSTPAAIIGSLGLDFDHQESGLILKGSESVKGYREVLQNTHYFNIHFTDGNKRIFYLECRMMNGMVVSNKLAVSLTITQPPAVPVATEGPVKKVDPVVTGSAENIPAARPFVLHKEVESRPAHHSKSRLSVDSPLPLLHNGGYEPYSRVAGGAASGGAVAIVVVVCVALILVLLVVGIMKLRATSTGGRVKRTRKSVSGDGDLTWDDSALNITVNPLEVGVESESGPAGYKTHRNSASDEDDSCDSEDDVGSFRDEDDVSDEDVESPLPHVTTTTGKSNGLEWDDSTLNGPTSAGPVGSGSRSQMFHV